ncbi:hypothetical protein M9Y10_037992 [Tritrichomonas musculus]|uniref:Mif2/CENP-C cupin domain-containing protein n=1 Tax=Tritrichomonas musculus TaxID=1915356 RepID=A0ABR2K754_9EUKA
MLMKASPSPFIHYFQPKAKYQMDASTHGRRTDSFLAADPIIDEDGHANVNDFFNKVHRVSDFSESPAHQKLFPPTPKTEIEPQSILESQQNNDYQNDIIIEEEEEEGEPLLIESKIDSDLKSPRFNPVKDIPIEMTYFQKEDDIINPFKTPDQAKSKNIFSRQNREEEIKQFSIEMTPAVNDARENGNKIKIPINSPYKTPIHDQSSPSPVHPSPSPAKISPSPAKSLSTQISTEPSEKKFVNEATTPIQKKINASSSPGMPSSMNKISSKYTNQETTPIKVLSFAPSLKSMQENQKKNQNKLDSAKASPFLKSESAKPQTNTNMQIESDLTQFLKDRYNQNPVQKPIFITSRYNPNSNQDDIIKINKITMNKFGNSEDSKNDDQFEQFGMPISSNRQSDKNIKSTSMNFFERLKKRVKHSTSSSSDDENESYVHNEKEKEKEKTQNIISSENMLASNQALEKFAKRRQKYISKENESIKEKYSNIGNYEFPNESDFYQTTNVTLPQITKNPQPNETDGNKIDNSGFLSNHQKKFTKPGKLNFLNRNNRAHSSTSTSSSDDDEPLKMNSSNTNSQESIDLSKQESLKGSARNNKVKKANNDDNFDSDEYDFSPSFTQNQQDMQSADPQYNQQFVQQGRNQINKQRKTHLDQQKRQKQLQEQQSDLQYQQQFAHQNQQYQSQSDHQYHQNEYQQQHNQQLQYQSDLETQYLPQAQYQPQLDPQYPQQPQYQPQLDPQYPQQPQYQPQLDPQYPQQPQYQPQIDPQYPQQPQYQPQLDPQYPQQPQYQPQLDPQYPQQPQYQPQLDPQYPQQPQYQPQLDPQYPQQPQYQPQLDPQYPQQPQYQPQLDPQYPQQPQYQPQLDPQYPQQPQYQPQLDPQYPQQPQYQPQLDPQYQQQPQYQPQLDPQYQQQPQYQPQLDPQYQQQPQNQPRTEEHYQQQNQLQPDQYHEEKQQIEVQKQNEDYLNNEEHPDDDRIKFNSEEQKQNLEKKEIKLQHVFKTQIDEAPVFKPNKQIIQFPSFPKTENMRLNSSNQNQYDTKNSRTVLNYPERTFRGPETITNGIFSFDIEKTCMNTDKNDNLSESGRDKENDVSINQRFGTELLELIKTPKSILKKDNNNDANNFTTPVKTVKIIKPEDNTFFPQLPISPAPDVNQMRTPKTVEIQKENEEESSDDILFKDIDLGIQNFDQVFQHDMNEIENETYLFSGLNNASSFSSTDDEDVKNDLHDTSAKITNDSYSTPVRKKLTLAEMEQNSIKKVRHHRHRHHSQQKSEQDQEEEQRRAQYEEMKLKEEEERRREEEEEKEEKRRREEEERRRKEEEERRRKEEEERKREEEEERRRKEEEEEEEERKREEEEEKRRREEEEEERKRKEEEEKRRREEEEEERKREEEEERKRKEEEEEKRRREEEEEERKRKEEEEKRKREEEEEEEKRRREGGEEEIRQKQIQEEEKQNLETIHEAEESNTKKKRRKKGRHHVQENNFNEEAPLMNENITEISQPISFEEMHNNSFPNYSFPDRESNDSANLNSSPSMNAGTSVIDVSTFQPLPSPSPPLSSLSPSQFPADSFHSLPSLPSSAHQSDNDELEEPMQSQENDLNSNSAKISKSVKKASRKGKNVVNSPPEAVFDPESDDLPIALRRTKRPRTQPLRYWMNEKIIYKPAPNGCLTQYAVQTDLQNSDEIDPLLPSNVETIENIIEESQKLKIEKEKKKKSSLKNDSEVIPRRIIPGIENPESSIISFKGIEKRSLKSNEIEILPQKSLDLDATKNKIVVVFSQGDSGQIEYKNGNKWKIRAGGQAYICKGDSAVITNLGKQNSIHLFVICN